MLKKDLIKLLNDVPDDQNIQMLHEVEGLPEPLFSDFRLLISQYGGIPYLVPDICVEVLRHEVGDFLTSRQLFALKLYRELIDEFNAIDIDNKLKEQILSGDDTEGIIKYIQNQILACMRPR